MSGVKKYHLECFIDNYYTMRPFVLASDYDRDTQALRAEVERLSGECEGCPMAIAEELRIERDKLRAQVEAMRAALEDAAKGILWLQASAPMSLRISKRASKDYNAAKRAASQAKP